MCNHEWHKSALDGTYRCFNCGKDSTFEVLVLIKLDTIISLLRKDKQ